ncbi:DUF4937 domain-containing protein [Peribacillus frigoritolerans]|uniref:DUF4937 domain-containing protein n=1 Tax=Peribacillus frigoritolerans TaxID=450367 RepID=UPI00207AC4FB|nr:DUF4937 domain-containing protein [Peribacillus frigoritolerans]
MKWIKCQVNEENKHSFSKAQEGGGHCAGLIGQIGGWNRYELFEAGVLSVWKDLHAYQSFTQHQHDEIFANYGTMKIHINGIWIPELPALIHESGVEDSTQRISVSLIELHPKWADI